MFVEEQFELKCFGTEIMFIYLNKLTKESDCFCCDHFREMVEFGLL